MTAPTFRLIHKGNLGKGELAAATRAINRFAEYGIRTEAMPLGEQAFQNVKMAAQLRDALGSSGQAYVNPGFLSTRFDESVSLAEERAGVAGIVLIGKRIFLLDDSGNGAQQEIPGRSRFRSGAIVTVAGVREAFGFDMVGGEYRVEAELAERTVEMLVRNTIGHVLIDTYRGPGKGFMECTDRACLMQEYFSIADLADFVVKPMLDFCGRCRERIEEEVYHLNGNWDFNRKITKRSGKR